MTGQLTLTLSLGLLVWLLIGAHTIGLNGPWYWTWEWRELPAARLYLSMALAALPFIAAQWLYRQARRPAELDISRRVRLTRAAYGCLMLAALCLQLVAIANQAEPFGLSRVSRIIQHPVVTSYFSDSAATGSLDFCEAGIRDFHDRMWGFSLHGRNKPPGAMLFFLPFHAGFSVPLAALVAGLTLALLACLAIPATALLVSELTADHEAGFASASFLALTPSLLLFFPAFDQLLPILSCLALVAWALALRRASIGYAIAFGGLLALALFFSFSFLVLGGFLAAYTFCHVAVEPRSRLGRVVLQTAVALVTLLLPYAILDWVFGFDAIATFRSALENQAALADRWGRPYPATVLFDLQDFVLGAGWIALPLACFALHRGIRGASPRRLAVVILCLAQPLLVAASGLIPTETARVWLFMLPLLMLPVGLTLARWSTAARAASFFCLWLILVATCQHMSFVVLQGDALSRNAARVALASPVP